MPKLVSKSKAMEKKRLAMKKKMDTLREQIKKTKAKATSDCKKVRLKAETKVDTLKKKMSELKTGSKPQQWTPPFKYTQLQ